MFTYTVDLPVSDSESATYKTWQDQEVASRVLAFNFTNPLGVNPCVNRIVAFYLPALVICAGVLNAFAFCVLKSNFLRHLVIQPMIRSLMYVQTLLIFFGPGYIWLVQHWGLYLTKYQLYPCFMIVWGHNFAVVASSMLVLAMIIERTVSIGRPEVLWSISRKACQNITNLFLAITLVFGAAGLMYIDGAVVDSKTTYPICLPWWGNEHPLVPPLWYKLLAFTFTLLPSLLIILSLALLASSVSGFKQKIATNSGALSHYSGMYLEIRSTLHLKFVKSVFWLGLLYVLASTPLGCFIIFGPAFYYRSSLFETDLSNSSSNLHHNSANSDFNSNVVTEDTTTNDSKIAPYSLLQFLDYSYLLVSRSNAEAMLWIVYYSFTLLVVPVLLVTEVLFCREWKDKIKSIITCRLFRRTKRNPMSGCDITELDNVNLVGPYIAKTSSLPSTRSLGNVECIKIYDAGKAERAGRRLDISKPEP